MQTKRNNINTPFFVTMLTACLGLLIVGTSSQAQAKSLTNQELTRSTASADFGETDLASFDGIEIKNNHRLQRFVLKFRNLINDFTLSAKQFDNFALGFFALPNQQVYELSQTSFVFYKSQKVSTYNNHTLTISNLARASL
jgi:hypothetical protein